EITASGYEPISTNIVLLHERGIFRLRRAITNGCPRIKIKEPSEIVRGRAIEFHADISGEFSDRPTYNWIVSAGKIIHGQGTPSITVDTATLGDQTITATVEVGGFNPACDKTASGSSTINN